ncbi:Guanylyl cyclase GC-E [Nymphon striatum]|nr:Guanylyl cyclase GC-E [Nymphon striatum]
MAPMNTQSKDDNDTMHDLRQENVNSFLGVLASPIMPSTVWESCARGSLDDIIKSEHLKLDWSFKLSLLTDLVKGMRYIHNSPVKYHGRLTSRNCVVDSRWVLKITDYGFPRIYELQGQVPPPREDLADLLWTAPELLRNEFLMRKGSGSGDIFSFAIILQEIILRRPPYCMLSLQPGEIISKLINPPPLIRPSVSKQVAPPEVINIMKQCWAENPDMRPDFNQIYDQFKSFSGKKGNIVDTMFQMLEKYSNNLEDLIRERTLQLDEEKRKTDQLLARMLPISVAESLKLGHPVEPENFEEVTIYFSDIVGFTTISAHSEPIEIIDLLNDLYTAFDATINHYTVYKVETIGDAYMVVGGLPERIKDHAEQVASMALDLLHICGKFKIRHLPKMPLRLRIGIHTGSCAAGVVGLTMPRYCLFGDTVNTASRMESTGSGKQLFTFSVLPTFRIHISSTTTNKLREAGGYHVIYRGEVELKVSKHASYWLTGKDGFEKELPEPVIDNGCESELLKYVERAPKPQQPSIKSPTHSSPNKTLLALQTNRRYSCDSIHTRPLSANRLNYISPIVTITSPRMGRHLETQIGACSPAKRKFSPSRMVSIETCDEGSSSVTAIRMTQERSLTPERYSVSVNSLESSTLSIVGSVSVDNASLKSEL